MRQGTITDHCTTCSSTRAIGMPSAAEAPLGSSAALYRLMAWLSPAYPVGAFSYSSGIEWAVEAGDISDARDAGGWLAS